MEAKLTPEQHKVWMDYWKGLGPRPIPVDHAAVCRVAAQINAMPTLNYKSAGATRKR